MMLFSDALETWNKCDANRLIYSEIIDYLDSKYYTCVCIANKRNMTGVWATEWFYYVSIVQIDTQQLAN